MQIPYMHSSCQACKVVEGFNVVGHELAAEFNKLNKKTIIDVITPLLSQLASDQMPAPK